MTAAGYRLVNPGRRVGVKMRRLSFIVTACFLLTVSANAQRKSGSAVDRELGPESAGSRSSQRKPDRSPSQRRPAPLPSMGGGTLFPSEPTPSPTGGALFPSPTGGALFPSEPTPSPTGGTLFPSQPRSSPSGGVPFPTQPWQWWLRNGPSLTGGTFAPPEPFIRNQPRSRQRH